MSKPKKKRPLMEPFGYISLDSFVIYPEGSDYIYISDEKCLSCKKSDYPRFFIDLEMIQDMKSPAHRGLQVHFALAGRRVHKAKVRKIPTRTRVDIYLQKDHALSLYKLLGNLLKQLGLLSE